MNRASFVLGTSLAILSVAGCGASNGLGGQGAPHAPPSAAAAPTAGWRELRTERFDLVTNLDVKDATRALEQLTSTYDLVRDIAFTDAPEMATPMFVVVFRTRAEYEAYGMRGSDAMVNRALPFEPEHGPAIVFHGDLDATKRATVAHEISHVLTHLKYRSVPTWLNEGLAEYVSTLEAVGDSAYLGRTPNFTRGWTSLYVPPFEAIRTFKAGEFYAKEEGGELRRDESMALSSHYIGAWCGVHMMMNGSPELRKRFDAYLAQLTTRESEHAWEQNFGDISIDELQKEFATHLARSFGVVWKTPYAAQKRVLSPITRDVPPSEVLLVEGELLSTHQNPAADYFREAARLAPTLAAPHITLGLSATTTAAKVAELEIAQKLEPTNASAIILLAQALATARRELPDEARAPMSDREKALWDVAVREANKPWELNALAWRKLNEGSLGAAFALAKKAIASDPLCFECRDTLAVIHSERGQVDLAYETELQALQLLPEGFSGEQLESRLQSFDKKRKAATKAKAAE